MHAWSRGLSRVIWFFIVNCCQQTSGGRRWKFELLSKARHGLVLTIKLAPATYVKKELPYLPSDLPQ